MKIRYVGPHAEVHIAATGQTAHRGIPLDVAAKVARALLEQVSWERVTEKKETHDG